MLHGLLTTFRVHALGITTHCTRGELCKPETSQDDEVSVITIHGNQEGMEG